MKGVRFFLSSGALGFLTLASALAQSPPVLSPARIYPLQQTPFLDKEGEVARDVSGIACMPPQGETRICLIINDENRFAQFAELGSNGFKAGAQVKLIEENGEAVPLGKIPSALNCSKGTAGFTDLDGEAVAYAKPYFYVIGSHGCSRKKSKFHASSFITARIRVNDKGEPVEAETGDPLKPNAKPAQLTYRVADALRTAPEVSAYFGKDLNEAGGLNIEGLVVTGGKLFAGLRAPSLGKRAFVVSTSVDDLFKPGNDPLAAQPGTWSVELGENRGIRDLALLSDGRILILAGPSQEQDVPYELFIVNSIGGTEATPLAILEDVVADGKKGKAEALYPLSLVSGKLRVLVLFDGLPNGAAREYELTIN